MAKKTQFKVDHLVEALAPALAGKNVLGVVVQDQPVAASRYRHLTVIWDRWKGISQQDRSRAILDAYELSHPDEKWRVLEITLALGLTTVEARKLNLKVA